MKSAVHLSKLVSLVVCLALLLSLAPIQPAQAVSPDIVISQVYGGGGNSGSTYKNDFIELYNRGSSAVDITGWSVQYASATGTTWTYRTNLSGTIQPGKYYLVQEAQGTGGTVFLPSPDAVGTIAMGGTAGKVALVNNTTFLTGACPAGVSTGTAAGIVDFVGFGTTANCYEGTGPTPAPSNSSSAQRKGSGATDTDNNANDFTAPAPLPRNSIYPFNGVGAATPSSLTAGQTTRLTVTITPGTSPDSTGITVSCNLAPIGGSASQVMYDDGTNGDVTASDNIFSFSIVDTVPGSQTLTCTFADQLRTGYSLITLALAPNIQSIGSVNGAVRDTDNGATHASPYAGQLVSVQGVIYEKTLQAISGSTNTYKGFFLQNTAATADADPNTSDGLFVFMSTGSTLPGPSGTTYTPTIGDEVVISGWVSEYYSMTELTSASLSQAVIRNVSATLDTVLPATEANPSVVSASAADANRYWERHQGMRMSVPAGSMTISGRNVFSPADAEIWMVRPDSTVAGRANPYARRAFRDANPLDDNYDAANWDGNGYRLLIGSLGIKSTLGDAQALIVPARSFETLDSPLVGGLNYTFSKYRIEVTQQPAFTEGVDPSTNNPPYDFAPRSSYYTISDYNLENLYDFRDNPFSGCDFVGNDGCPSLGTPFSSDVTPPYDYVPASDAAYQSRLGDIAYQIIYDLHSPDILMVQEVENQDICSVTAGEMDCDLVTGKPDGKPDVLQELALKVAILGGPAYEAVWDPDSSDLRGIAPAYLYRTDRVELLPTGTDPILSTSPAIPGYTAVPYDSDVSNPKTLNAVLPAGVTACETSWVFPRAPDVGLFRIYANSIGNGSYSDVYVINNHFKSGPDSCVPHRTEQAKYNAALIAYIQTNVPGAKVVIGGDLNVYPYPDNTAYGAVNQLGSLYEPDLGLKNLWEVLNVQAPAAAYSYVYLGQAQTLDQMFINASLLAKLQSYRVAHVNSDFAAEYPAPATGLLTVNAASDYPGDVGRGTSDHDPSVAIFAFSTPTAVNLVDYATSVVPAGGIQIRWTTAGEGQISGFNLLRGLSASDPNPVKVNASLIAAQTPGGGGSSYTFEDLTAQPSVMYYYTLEQVSTTGGLSYSAPLGYQYFKMYAPLLRR